MKPNGNWTLLFLTSLTPYTVEIMLHEQLTEIARQHFQFLGVAATDPTDLVFIVQEARKYCPGVQIFTLASHALFSHPDLLRDLDGLLVASTYPLALKLDATTHAPLFRLSALLLIALEHIWRDHPMARAEGEAEPAPLAKLAGADRIIATAEVIVARQVITLVRHALGRLRGLMTFVSAGALLLVCAVASYPFHPQRLVSLFVWSIAIGATGAILFVILGAERDAVLSRMARTRPGRIDLNPALVAKVALYGLLPAALLAASAFPQIGDLLFSWLNTILRAFH